MTTHLEKSGNWKVVREKSGKLEKVRESYNHHLAGARVAKILPHFKELCGLAQTKYKKLFADFDRTDQNLDVFYSKILAGDGKQAALWKVVRMLLTLSHGQASVESGFSINKELLILLLVCVSFTIIGQPRNSVLIRRV